MTFAELDERINAGLVAARALVQPTEIECPMCSGPGCPRCAYTGKMTTRQAVRLAVKLVGNRRAKRGQDGKGKKQRKKRARKSKTDRGSRS